MAPKGEGVKKKPAAKAKKESATTAKKESATTKKDTVMNFTCISIYNSFSILEEKISCSQERN